MPDLMGIEKEKQAFHQRGHEAIIQRFHGIRGSMIVGVAKKSSVRDHDRLKSLVPERGMITEPDSRKDPPVERNP